MKGGLPGGDHPVEAAQIVGQAHQGPFQAGFDLPPQRKASEPHSLPSGFRTPAQLFVASACKLPPRFGGHPVRHPILKARPGFRLRGIVFFLQIGHPPAVPIPLDRRQHSHCGGLALFVALNGIDGLFTQKPTVHEYP